MRQKFEQQLEELNHEMIVMGEMISLAIKQAICALADADEKLAKSIMEEDIHIDRQQKKIEQICFNLLVQQQPVAKDLRMITAAMKMVTDMERIGDHAADISEITILLGKNTLLKRFGSIGKMASETMLMLQQSMEAYINRNQELAYEVIERDDLIDALFDNAKQDIIKLIVESPKEGEDATDYLLVAKYFERIGDHATNIAEWVLYALRTGEE